MMNRNESTDAMTIKYPHHIYKSKFEDVRWSLSVHLTGLEISVIMVNTTQHAATSGLVGDIFIGVRDGGVIV